jgi:ATP synthase subunit 6
MLSQYYLFQHCNRTVLSRLPKFNIVHSRNWWGEKAFEAAKHIFSKTKTKGMQVGHTARKHIKKAVAPNTSTQWIIGATLGAGTLGVGAAMERRNTKIKRIEKQSEAKAAQRKMQEELAEANAARERAENKAAEANAAKERAEDKAANTKRELEESKMELVEYKREVNNEKNSEKNIVKDLFADEIYKAHARKKGVVFLEDCDNRSILTKGEDYYNNRDCADLNVLNALAQAKAITNKDKSNPDKPNHSPFENFELILFFPSFGFWLIFLFTSFNLVLFQIILMLFNLHGFLISNFGPNSLILRSNAVLINFLFNLHCSQSYSQFLLKYFPITLTVFIFILFGNLTGLLPWSFSYTGHIGLTFSLGIMLFQGWLVVGLDRLGGDFWALFIPHNCPKWLFPLMLVIEILSFVIRPFSLAIRLFANILSGHILLHLIKETEEIIRDSENNGYMNMIPSSGSSLVSLSESMVIILELGVACLQGYIFAILSSIYLQESVNERNLGLKSIKEYRSLGYKFINKYILKID